MWPAGRLGDENRRNAGASRLRARSLSKAGEDERVGAVDDGGVEAGEVDLGGGLAVVAHAFGNDRKRNAFGLGGGGPAVAGDVEGQRHCHAHHAGYAFQVVVDVVADVAVGASLVGADVADDGEQEIAFVLGIFVEYRLHLCGPRNDKSLARLAAAVGDVAVSEVSAAPPMAV